MAINLQDLKSTFTLDTKPLQLGAKAAIAGVGALVAGIGIAAKATMDWAADLDSLGDVADGAGDSLAAMAFIARKSGIGVEALTKSTTMLNKGLLKQDGTLDKIGKSLKDYGIDVKGANGQVKDSVQLTDEIAKKYAELGTQQERVNFLTEIYGKSGAQMIDFFDTLNADGGISSVTEKVKALGLAIDPARYEQFNRNLEEMKLMGLGVAVSFTEKLMPILESLTDWAMNKGIPAFIDFKKKLEGAFRVGGLGEALKVLDEEVSKWLEELDWAGWGTKFGEQIDKALSMGISEVDMPKFAVSLGNGIKEFLTAAVGEENLRVFQAHFVDYIKLKLAEVGKLFITWATNNPREALATFSAVVQGTMPTVMNNMGMLLENKLREIGKKFYTRAAGWVQQAIQGFTGQTGSLISTVSNLVASINAELRRIITSFRISISTVFGGQGGASGTASVAANSSGSPDDRDEKSVSAVPVSTASTSSPKSDKPVTAIIPRENMYDFAMVVKQMIVKDA